MHNEFVQKMQIYQLQFYQIHLHTIQSSISKTTIPYIIYIFGTNQLGISV